MQFPKARFERLIIRIALWVVFVLLLVFGVFLTGSTWQVWQKERTARAERDAALTERADLEMRKEKLKTSIEALNSERGQEAELRNRFMVVKEGEEVIMLVDAKPETQDTDTHEANQGVWGAIRSWFGW